MSHLKGFIIGFAHAIAAATGSSSSQVGVTPRDVAGGDTRQQVAVFNRSRTTLTQFIPHEALVAQLITVKQHGAPSEDILVTPSPLPMTTETQDLAAIIAHDTGPCDAQAQQTATNQEVSEPPCVFCQLAHNAVEHWLQF